MNFLICCLHDTCTIKTSMLGVAQPCFVQSCFDLMVALTMKGSHSCPNVFCNWWTRSLSSPSSLTQSSVWFQLMKEVRSGVRLRNTSERRYTPVPVKPESSSFMKILDDIKYKRYILHKVAVSSCGVCGWPVAMQHGGEDGEMPLQRLLLKCISLGVLHAAAIRVK